MALVRLQTQPVQLLALLGIVWVADSAAYLAGKSFGRRKFAPKISPGKTWEGVVGAGTAVAVYYSVLRFVFAPETPWLGGPGGMLLCGAITIMSIEGDLFESWMKRQVGVKDSGTLLPGHGGVLDRMDGLTASMPLAALVSLYYLG
jgi:phosphatidate cytidylyltransferase